MSTFRNIFAATALALFVGLAMTPTLAIATQPYDGEFPTVTEQSSITTSETIVPTQIFTFPLD